MVPGGRHPPPPPDPPALTSRAIWCDVTSPLITSLNHRPRLALLGLDCPLDLDDHPGTME